MVESLFITFSMDEPSVNDHKSLALGRGNEWMVTPMVIFPVASLKYMVDVPK